MKDKKQQHKVFFDVLDTFNIERPIPEFIFHSQRKWRMDYAWPHLRIALEVEGGIFTNGRHSRGAGMQEDMVKYNQAALLGWRIIRTTPKNLCKTETVNLINQMLKQST